MLLLGLEFLLATTRAEHFSAKMVFNEAGAIFFPVSREHRDQKAPDISYEDNYKGNALAAMLAPSKLEIRYHNAFTDNQVTRVVASLVAIPDLAFMSNWTITYQGRVLDISRL